MINKDSTTYKLENRILFLEKSLNSKSEIDDIKSSTIIDLQNRILTLEHKNNELTYSDYISGFSVLLSLVTAICLLGFFIYKTYDKRRIKLRKFLTGEWTTEGDITDPQPLPYINFEIEVDYDDGEITGVFNTYNDSYPCVLSINGRLKSNKAILKITHVGQQKLLTYAVVKISIKDKLMKWKTVKGEAELFPKSAIAWKTN
jgi:hypothetical protein